MQNTVVGIKLEYCFFCYLCMANDVYMSVDRTTLSIKDFRAINKAEISLNGITVVSGVNGCGKSTMSKLLYYIFKESAAYEKLLLKYFNDATYDYRSLLLQIYQLSLRNTSSRSPLRRSFYLRSFNPDDVQEFKARIDEIIEEYLHMTDADAPGISRIRKIAESIFNEDNSSSEDIASAIRDKYESVFAEVEILADRRPFMLLKKAVSNRFRTEIKGVEVSEFGELFFGDDLEYATEPHAIKKVLYFDTPMAMGMDDVMDAPDYWSELNDMLRHANAGISEDRGLLALIRANIKGEAVCDDDSMSYDFGFRSDTGEIFDIMDCATGIKSFAILQLLLKNNYLDKSTLLIIDEPEAHLHPQWIVEYARLIVLINKVLKVKFFIASHSTDMVSAIRYISEKEGVLSDVDFYVAEEDENGKYSFNWLDNDIEPIFESFNKSFDKVAEYSRGEEDHGKEI